MTIASQLGTDDTLERGTVGTGIEYSDCCWDWGTRICPVADVKMPNGGCSSSDSGDPNRSENPAAALEGSMLSKVEERP